MSYPSFFFIFSIFTEIALGRHRSREKRYGPSPANNYTSGYGSGGGLFGWLRRRRTAASGNILPEHTHPEQLETRQSYGTEATAVGYELPGYNKHGEYNHAAYPQSGAKYDTPYPTSPRHPVAQPSSYRYDDGVYEQM